MDAGAADRAVSRLNAGVGAHRADARRTGVDNIESLHRLAERAVRVPKSTMSAPAKYAALSSASSVYFTP